MSNDANSDTFDYDFTTPYTNGTSTSGEPKHEMRRNTIRRVSFGDIPDEYLKSLSPQELSPPTTPTKSGGTKMLVTHGKFEKFCASYGWVEAHDNGVMLDTQCAENLGVRIGDTVTFIPRW